MQNAELEKTLNLRVMMSGKIILFVRNLLFFLKYIDQKALVKAFLSIFQQRFFNEFLHGRTYFYCSAELLSDCMVN